MFSFVKKKFELSIKIKLMISYLILFTLPLIAMGIISYTWLSGTIENIAKSNYSENLTNSIETIDTHFKEISSLTGQISQISWVKKMMYNYLDSYDSLEGELYLTKDHSKQLATYVSTNNYLEDIAICFNNMNIVLSSTSISRVEDYFTKEFSIDGIDLNKWNDYVNSLDTNYGTILQQQSIHKFGKKKEGFIYLKILKEGKSSVNSYIIAFVNKKTVESELKKVVADNNSGIYMLNAEKRLLAGINTDADMLKRIVTGNLPNDELFREQKQIIFSGKSLNYNWEYIVSVPVAYLMKNVNRVRMVVWLLILISIGIGIGMSYEMAKINYKPLNNLLQIINERVNSKSINGRNDEYKWLESEIHSLIQHEELLSNRLESNKPVLKQNYLSQLFNKETEMDAEFLKALDLLDITFNYTNFCCGAINARDENACDQLINCFLREAEQYNILLYNTVINKKCVVVFNYDKMEQFLLLMSKIDCLFKELKKESVSIGLGNHYSDLEQVHNSYQEALMALNYRLIKGNNSVIYFEEVINKDYPYYYPIDKEFSISSYLKAGDLKNAVQLFQSIVEKNIVNKNLSANAIINFFYNGIFTCVRVVQEADLNDSIKIVPEQLFTFESIDEMRHYIEGIFKDICELVNHQKTIKDDTLKQTIIDYIDQVLTDRGMSLQMVAQHFNISTSYLSKYCKEQYGWGFHDYVNRKRIEKAMSMIATTKSDITNIARSIGYDDYSTFRKLFKRYVGIPPSEYRERT